VRRVLSLATGNLLLRIQLPFTIILIAGCSTNTGAIQRIDPQNTYQIAPAAQHSYAGRISLVIDSGDASGNTPAQNFSGSFELRGNAQTGQLDLLSPLGSVVAQLRWSPQEAQLQSGSEIRRYASAAALLEQATGLTMPPQTLFDWLQGKPSSTEMAFWRVDLSRHSEGRISAQRSAPTPAQLRIILEQP
jgi:outer membrane lipoprotein LolB